MEDFFKEKDFYELLSEASNNNSIVTINRCDNECKNTEDHINISDIEFENIVAMYDYACSLAYGKDLCDGEEYIGTTNDPESTNKAYQIISEIYDRIKRYEPSVKQSSNINWSGTKETSLLRIFDYYHKVVEPVRDLIKESKPHAKVKAIEEDKPNKSKGKVLQFEDYLTGCDKDRIIKMIRQDKTIRGGKNMAVPLLALHNLGYINIIQGKYTTIIKALAIMILGEFKRTGTDNFIRDYLGEKDEKMKKKYDNDWGINRYMDNLRS